MNANVLIGTATREAAEYATRIGGTDLERMAFQIGMLQGMLRDALPPAGTHQQLDHHIEQALALAHKLSREPMVSDDIGSVIDSLSDAAGHLADVYYGDDEPNYGEGSGGDLAREAAAINRENDRRAA